MWRSSNSQFDDSNKSKWLWGIESEKIKFRECLLHSLQNVLSYNLPSKYKHLDLYPTVTLPLVFIVLKWCVTLSEGKNIGAVGEDVVRRIYVFKTCGNRRMKKLQDEEIQNVYSVLNIIKGSKIQTDELSEVPNSHGKEWKHV